MKNVSLTPDVFVVFDLHTVQVDILATDLSFDALIPDGESIFCRGIHQFAPV